MNENTYLLTSAAIIIFLVAGILIFTEDYRKQKKIEKKGMKTAGVVTNVSMYFGRKESFNRIYVKYLDKNDTEKEALVLNFRPSIFVGDEVEIKYLPPNYEIAVLIFDDV